MPGFTDSGQALIFEVCLHEQRYHGAPEWPPSPARLFQALIAGTANRSGVSQAAANGFRWLEDLASPVIASPRHRMGVAAKHWVPNNDLDAKGGDPAETAQIRTAKTVTPRLLEGHSRFLYAWMLHTENDVAMAEEVIPLSSTLYQFGRGIDMAWARAAVASLDDLDKLLSVYDGEVRRPTVGSWEGGTPLQCPRAGSFDSLEERHRATLNRFQRIGSGRASKLLFAQPPKARFKTVIYDALPERALFEIRTGSEAAPFFAWPQERIVQLCEALRDDAAARLRAGLPDRADEIEQALVGRTPAGRRRIDAKHRVRIVPLPSIGHEKVDRSVRRVAVEVPAGCPLQAQDIFWAFSSVEVGAGRLLPTSETTMLDRHYGAAKGAASWQTVTPVALPAWTPAEAEHEGVGSNDTATAREAEELHAMRAIRDAVRHVGITAGLVEVRVQRDPMKPKSSPARQFASGTRFASTRLWHVEIEFDRVVRGPLLLGDGRFLGLGLLAPKTDRPDSISFAIVDGWHDGSEPLVIARALRRAVIARCQQERGRDPLPGLVTGHADDGRPARGHGHLSCVCDPHTRHLHVLVPAGARRADFRLVESALRGFRELRAGTSGLLEVVPARSDLAEMAATWRTLTPYVVERHPRSGSATEALATAATQSCTVLGLPKPEVEVERVIAEPGRPLAGLLTLRFPVTITGPLLIGRTSHRGGGFCRAILPGER